MKRRSLCFLLVEAQSFNAMGRLDLSADRLQRACAQDSKRPLNGRCDPHLGDSACSYKFARGGFQIFTLSLSLSCFTRLFPLHEELLAFFLSPSAVLMPEKLSVLPPRDPWHISFITDEDLEALVDAGLLHPPSQGPQPEWYAPGDEQEPAPPAGYVVSFTSFHERGFRVPVSGFMRALPHYYGVELHNFNPNSIAQATIFTTVCEGYLGIEPHWDLWLHLFRAEAFSLPCEVKKVRHAVRACGCTLLLHSNRA